MADEAITLDQGYTDDARRQREFEAENTRQKNTIHKTVQAQNKAMSKRTKSPVEEAAEAPASTLVNKAVSWLHGLLDAGMNAFYGLFSILVLPGIGLFAFRLSKNGDSGNPMRMKSIPEMGQHLFSIFTAGLWLTIWSALVLFVIMMYFSVQNSWGCQHFAWAANAWSKYHVGYNVCSEKAPAPTATAGTGQSSSSAASSSSSSGATK